MHNIEYYDYPENVKKDYVQAEMDAHVRCEDYGEGASGTPMPIRWVDKTYESREEAEAAIEAESKRIWYNCQAVKFKSYPRAFPTKEITDLRQKAAKASDDYWRIVKECSIHNRKSEFIGCPNCKSSMKLELVHGEKCPLCKTDLRSKTSLERMAKADARLGEAQKRVQNKETEQSRKQKPTIMWLVKIEYHT